MLLSVTRRISGRGSRRRRPPVLGRRAVRVEGGRGSSASAVLRRLRVRRAGLPSGAGSASEAALGRRAAGFVALGSPLVWPSGWTTLVVRRRRGAGFAGSSPGV